LKFRFRVSLEIIKWLIYAVVRRKKNIIIEAKEGVNDYEFYFVKIVRDLLIYFYKK